MAEFDFLIYMDVSWMGSVPVLPCQTQQLQLWKHNETKQLVRIIALKEN